MKMCLLRDSHEKYIRARQAIIWHEKGAICQPCDEDKYLLSCNMKLLISRSVKFGTLWLWLWMCPCILYKMLFEGQKVQNFDTQKCRGCM